MYGVVAGHGQDTKSKPVREQSIEIKEKKSDRNKNKSFTVKLLDYIQRRLNPPSAPAPVEDIEGNSSKEECSESMGSVGGRHRPEALSALAQATRFTPHEIKLMYRGFKQECPTGVVDEAAFKKIFCQFFPLGDASQYAHLVFNSIKHKESGKLTFEEFLEVLSRVGRGSLQEKLSWVFTLYDADGDGRVTHAELAAVVGAVYDLLGHSVRPSATHQAAIDHTHRIFHAMDADGDGVVTREELAGWVARDPALLRSLDTLDTVL